MAGDPIARESTHTRIARANSSVNVELFNEMASSTAAGFAGLIQCVSALQGQVDTLTARVSKLEGQLSVTRTLSQGRKRT